MPGGLRVVPPTVSKRISGQSTRTFGFAPCASSFFDELEARDVAGRPRRGRRQIADARVAGRARLAQPRDRVQRRRARVGQVRIGAVVEQHGRGLVERVHDRDVERARAVGREVVRVRAVVEQIAQRVDLRVAHREQERRGARLRLRVDVRAGLDQRRHDVDVALARGPHERGLAAPAFGRVDRGAVREQRLDRVELAGARRGHQRRLPSRDVAFTLAPAASRRSIAARSPLPAARSSGVDVETVRGVRGRARVEQRVDQREVVDLGREVQRGRAVALGRRSRRRRCRAMR